MRINRIATLLILGGGIFVTGCANPNPGATIDVKLPPGPEQQHTIMEMRSRAEVICLRLGFEPLPENFAVGKFFGLPDGGGWLVLAVYQLPQDRDVILDISRHTVPGLGPMLGVSVNDYGTSGFEFGPHSVAKLKLLELLDALRKEFGRDRIYLGDWARKHIQ